MRSFRFGRFRGANYLDDEIRVLELYDMHLDTSFLGRRLGEEDSIKEGGILSLRHTVSSAIHLFLRSFPGITTLRTRPG